MDICVVTADKVFFSAVHGVAGAMGHSARLTDKLADVGPADLVVGDFRSEVFDFECMLAAADPLRTAIFVPQEDQDAMNRARAHGFAHVLRRGSLAQELPRLLSEYA
jgi:hypothetical protein